MDGHQRRRARIEKRIVQSAMKLFSERGFKHVSIEDIAKSANVSKVTLYKYFTNKPTLIRACLMSSFHQRAEEVRILVEGGTDFLSKLELLMKNKINFIQSFGGEMLHELATLDPVFVEQLMAIRTETMMELSIPLLEEGRSAGHISSEISNESLIVFFDIIGVGIVNSPSYRNFADINPNAFNEIQRIAMCCIAQLDH